MAGTRQTNARHAQTRRAGSRQYTTTYVDGNVVRHLQTVPRQTPTRRRHQTAQVNTQRNRQKALQMTMPYVVFLSIAAIATVFLCVTYLKLQAAGITYRSEIASLESRISTMRLANDNAYEDAVSSVNMEQVKEIAVNDLGMTYAKEGQIITYSSQDGDYIRQYGEIPAE